MFANQIEFEEKQSAQNKTQAWKKVMAFMACIVLAGALAAPLAACGGSNKIEGNYIVVEGSFGQMQPGAAVVFNGSECNVFSPRDTYAFNGSTLTVTGLLGGNITFQVDINGKEVVLNNGSSRVVLERQS